MAEECTGNWKSVSAAKDIPVRGKLFTLWIDHGTAPKNASYSYIVTPEELPVSKLRTFNTPEVQAVCDASAGGTGIVFYTAGRSLRLGGHTYSASAPCVLLHTPLGLFAADPAQCLKQPTLTVDGTAVEVPLSQTYYTGAGVRAEHIPGTL